MYKPISLISVPGKVLESIINDKVINFLETNNLINTSQHGFRQGRFCVTNLLDFYHYVSHVSASCESSGSSNTYKFYDDFIFHSNTSNCNSGTKTIIMTAELAGVPVQLEVDTGAGCTILSKTRFWTLFGRDNLSLFKILPFYFCSINVIKDDAFTKGLADKLPNLFSDGLGCYRDYEATFDINTEDFPKFCKAHTVPYAMKPKLDAALDSLLADGIISPINNSKWAAPVVPVLEPDNTIRVCGDYKVTANKVIKLDTYPIPKPKISLVP